MNFEKIPTEAELVSLLKEGALSLGPLSFVVEETTPWLDGRRVDAFVRVEWEKRAVRFVAEVTRHWTPKAVTEKIHQARLHARPPEFHPLIVAPYLPESRLSELESAGVSGVDLCGNGVIVVPGEILAYRTGRPNRFRSEAEIKNVFRGNSAVVSRAFLAVPEFNSVQEAEREIRKRGGSVTLPTISKVCKSLESMLIVERLRGEGSSARRLRLLQPDKLLDLLAANYVLPSVTRKVRGKTRLSPEGFREKLAARGLLGERIVKTGFGSVGDYAVMAAEPTQYFYTSSIDRTLAALEGAFEETGRFANVEFDETGDDAPFFDRRPGLLASPVQAFLELSAGDKRSKETAEQVRRLILEPLARGGRG